MTPGTQVLLAVVAANPGCDRRRVRLGWTVRAGEFPGWPDVTEAALKLEGVGLLTHDSGARYWLTAIGVRVARRVAANDAASKGLTH